MLTCAHPFGKAFHALFACHDHRCCKQRHGSAHYAFGCRLETRAQSSLGIFRLPAQDHCPLSMERETIQGGVACAASPSTHQRSAQQQSKPKLSVGQPQAEDVIEGHLRLRRITRRLQATVTGPSCHASRSQGDRPEHRASSRYSEHTATLNASRTCAKLWRYARGCCCLMCFPPRCC